MTFPANTLSATPTKYLFKLISGSQTIVCDPEPLEWASGQLIINRDLSVGGVFSTFQGSSLTFIGNGAKLLRSLWEAYEFNAECTLVIYYFKNSTREYVEFPSRFKVDFNMYEIVKVGKFAFGVRIKAVNSSLQTKLDSRKDVDVNLNKLVSIGEVPFTNWTPNKNTVNYSATNVHLISHLWKNSLDGWDLPRKPGAISYCSVPVDLKDSYFTEGRSVVYTSKQTDITRVNSFFKSADFDYTFNLTYRFVIDVISDNVNDQWEMHLLETKTINGIDVVQNENDTLLCIWGSTPDYNVFFTDTIEVTVAKGNDLKLVIRVANTNSLKSLLKSCELTLSQTIADATLAKQTTGYPIYEAFERVCQHMMDIQWPFYSEFFGRTDVYKNASFQKYSSENQLRFAHLQSGLNLRGVGIYEDKNTFTVNFKDLFKTAQSIWNVGYAFETIDGSLRLRIEEYAHFFQDVMVLDLSARINVYDIVSLAMPELAPVQFNSGFSSYEYLQLNGLSEPNTTNQRTSKLNTDAKFDNISPYRGDTKGILSALAAPIDSTDTKNDEGMFILKTQKDGANWKPEKAENITIELNSSIFGEDLLNRYFTPSRMLKRQANRIASGLTKLQDSKLTFQTSDKLQGLRTNGEGYIISENEDILVSSLGAPLYRPIKHTVECYFDWSDLEAIQANLFGYIIFSDKISGFLLNLKKKNNEDKSEITIIQRYVP